MASAERSSAAEWGSRSTGDPYEATVRIPPSSCALACTPWASGAAGDPSNPPSATMPAAPRTTPRREMDPATAPRVCCAELVFIPAPPIALQVQNGSIVFSYTRLTTHDTEDLTMALATIPGYPRIGKRRELKRGLEGYWSGKRTAPELEETASAIRRANWDAQTAAGLDLVPVNDFSLYDHVLDTCALVGAVPARFGWAGDTVDLDLLFAMARGGSGHEPARAMELTKWFDTNYHYLVPEFSAGQTFHLASEKPFAELAEAQAAGVSAKPVLLGPINFLLLGKMTGEESSSALSLLDALLPVYAEAIQRLASGGAEWIQLDEPVLVTDLTPDQLAAVERAYAVLAEAKGSARLLVQTAYGHVGEAYPILAALPVDGIGLDFVRGPQNRDFLTQNGFPADKWLAAGVVDGRNIWTTDLAASLDLLARIQEHVPSERLMISASCSMQHVPYDVELDETPPSGGGGHGGESLPAEVRPWL